jgi:phage I-like protein
MNNQLFALFQNAPLNGEAKVKLAVTGAWKGHPTGEFAITADDLAQIKSNFERQKALLPIDYEHQTLTGAKAPAAGWIKSLAIEGDALIAEVDWLTEAAEHIKAKAYRYISPVFSAKTIDQISGENIGWTLHSAGLTNKPFLDELGELSLNKITSQKNKEAEMEKEKEESLSAEIKALKAENDALKTERENERNKIAETFVGELIANKKIDEKIKDKALIFAKADIESFKAVIGGVLVGEKEGESKKTPPESNLYPNKNVPKEGDDGEYKDLAKYV